MIKNQSTTTKVNTYEVYADALLRTLRASSALFRSMYAGLEANTSVLSVFHVFCRSYNRSLLTADSIVAHIATFIQRCNSRAPSSAAYLNHMNLLNPSGANTAIYGNYVIYRFAPLRFLDSAVVVLVLEHRVMIAFTAKAGHWTPPDKDVAALKRHELSLWSRTRSVRRFKT